jgi:hypothetical protein
VLLSFLESDGRGEQPEAIENGGIGPRVAGKRRERDRSIGDARKIAHL